LEQHPNNLDTCTLDAGVYSQRTVCLEEDDDKGDAQPTFKARLMLIIPPRAERGLHFVVVQRRVKFGQISADWPILYLIEDRPPEGIALRPYKELLHYFGTLSAMSNEWRRQVATAVGLHIDYCIAALEATPAFAEASAPRTLLEGFARALIEGTIRISNGRQTDPLGLFWRGRSKDRASRYLSALSSFYLYLERSGLGEICGVADLLQEAAKDPRVVSRLAAAAAIRSKKSLLAHLGPSPSSPSHFSHGLIGKVHQNGSAPPRFPEKFMAPFLNQCFREGDQTDFAAETIAHILFLGGIRTSEAFHLFTSDVQFLNGAPLVILHHPSHGRIMPPGTHAAITRRIFLESIGLNPRTEAVGKLAAGWKGLLDDTGGTQIYWLPLTKWQEKLGRLLINYLSVIRPRIMASRPAHVRDHPFLFVSSGRTSNSGGMAAGEPYTLSAFRASWKRAFCKLQRAFPEANLRYEKSAGTTPHGTRHFYGNYATVTLGLERHIVREMMHHNSFESQDIYTRPSVQQVHEILSNARIRE
jgi:site-specific recombinase XerD